MEIIVTLSFIGALVMFIIYQLHKYEVKGSQINIDRSTPLPPLSNEEKWRSKQLVDPENEQEDYYSSLLKNEKANDDKMWLEDVKHLRKHQQLRQAQAICYQMQPLKDAFEQTCLILRAEIRELDKKSNRHAEALDELYRTAAYYSFLYDKLSDSQPSLHNTVKYLKRDDWVSLDMPYEKIGYDKLKLLKKNDIKALIALWGEAKTHQSARQYHRRIWADLQKKVSSAVLIAKD